MDLERIRNHQTKFKKKKNETGKTAENQKVDQERDFPNELIGSLEPGAYPTSPLQFRFSFGICRSVSQSHCFILFDTIYIRYIRLFCFNDTFKKASRKTSIQSLLIKFSTEKMKENERNSRKRLCAQHSNKFIAYSFSDTLSLAAGCG